MDRRHALARVVAAVLVVAAGGFAASCVHSPAPLQESPPGYTFDYRLGNRERAGLIQVFDDGSKTYLQFADWSHGNPTIRDADGTEVPWRRTGGYAVVEGRHEHLTVDALGAQAFISGPGVASSVTSLAGAVAPMTADDPTAAQAKVAELEALRARISTLEAQIAEARAAVLATGDTLVIHFANNSARLTIDPEAMHAIAEIIGERDAIVVTGFTDATYSDAAGAKLARQRAFTVRDALMAEGVPATHVNVAYHAAGLFAVDNGSATGKALNRRAEIVAKGDPVEPRG